MVVMVGIPKVSPKSGHFWHPKNTSQKWSLLTPHVDGTTWVSAGHPTDDSSWLHVPPAPPNMGIGWMVNGGGENVSKKGVFYPPQNDPKNTFSGGGYDFCSEGTSRVTLPLPYGLPTSSVKSRYRILPGTNLRNTVYVIRIGGDQAGVILLGPIEHQSPVV